MTARRYDAVPDNHIQDEHNYIDIPDLTNLSLFKEAAVYCIAGYFAKMLRNRITCPDCLPALIDENDNYYRSSAALLLLKDEAGMTNPADSVVKICMATEKLFQKLFIINEKSYSTKTVVCHLILCSERCWM